MLLLGRSCLKFMQLLESHKINFGLFKKFAQTTMTSKNIPVTSHALHVPDLAEVAKVLNDGLTGNFANVSVSVVDCPDLTQEPFLLASPGLCGEERVVDVGGPPYLIPLADRTKLYDIADIASLCNLKSGLVVGAGAGPWPKLGTNSEMVVNVKVGDNPKVETYICKINRETKRNEQITIDTTDFALMSNLYMSSGTTGKVLEVKASKRTGPANYMTCLREVLKSHYGDKPVGLGGTFLVEKGKTKLHVMPDFSTCPLNSNEDVQNWLTFHEEEGPVVIVGYLVSTDPGWDLRIEHFHGYSKTGCGGHYHYDVTPDEVVYRGYFNVPQTLYRVDAPVVTHQVGRD